MRLLTAQLLLDDAHLLLQVVLLLPAIHLLADAVADAAVDIQDLDLPLQDRGQLLQPRVQLEGFEHVLLVGHADVQVGGDDVRQPAGLLHASHREVDLRRHLLVQLDVAIEERDHATHQSLQLGGGCALFLQAGRLDAQVRIDLDESLDDRPRGALNQDLDGAVRQLEHLDDVTQHAHAVEVFFLRVLAVGLALGAEKNLLALRHRLLERADRPFAPDIERHDHVRE